MNIIFFIKSKYKEDNSVEKKIMIRKAHVLIQIILLHGFDVCISIVKLNRYVTK